MEYKFSDFDPINSPSDNHRLVGYFGSDNTSYTLSVLGDFFQSRVAVVEPLPAGTPTKVMYFNPNTNKWGSSTSVNTDGFVVNIGSTEPVSDTLLDIENNDNAYNSLINAYNRNASDEVVKLLNYSKFGILHVTDGSIPANIDSEDRAFEYGMFVEKSIMAGGLVMENDGNKRIQWGSVDETDGSLTPTSTIYANDTALKNIALTHLTYISTETNSNIITRASLNATANLKRFDIGSGSEIQNWNSLAGGAHGTIWGMNSIEGSSNFLGKVGIGNKGGGAYISIGATENPADINLTNMIFAIDPDGKIIVRLPITVGGAVTGPILHLYNDGGILKLGAY